MLLTLKAALTSYTCILAVTRHTLTLGHKNLQVVAGAEDILSERIQVREIDYDLTGV